MSAAAPLASTSGSGTASGHNKLVRAAARTYREFIWSVCFGLVTVASAPLMVVVMLGLGAFKTASDHVRIALAKRKRFN